MALNGFINGKTSNETTQMIQHTWVKKSALWSTTNCGWGKPLPNRTTFPTSSPILNDRRGDIILLVCHCFISNWNAQASLLVTPNWKLRPFRRLFRVIFIIFVAMNPEETKYFANPGPHLTLTTILTGLILTTNQLERYRSTFPVYSHGTSAHYTVADKTDGVLKVMRSYQQSVQFLIVSHVLNGMGVRWVYLAYHWFW